MSIRTNITAEEFLKFVAGTELPKQKEEVPPLEISVGKKYKHTRSGLEVVISDIHCLAQHEHPIIAYIDCLKRTRFCGADEFQRLYEVVPPVREFQFWRVIDGEYHCTKHLTEIEAKKAGLCVATKIEQSGRYRK